MKKSNILLVVFAAMFPAGLFLYNRLLATDFLEGKVATTDHYTTAESTMNRFDYRPFKYVVADGALKVEHKAAQQETAFWYHLPVTIERDAAYAVEINQYYMSYVKVRQAGDTLYVTMESEFMVDGFTVTNVAVRITAPSLDNVSLATGKYYLANFQGADTFHLKASNSEVNMANMKFPVLDIAATAHSGITLPGGNDGPDVTRYNLDSGSGMIVPTSFGGKLEAGQVDSSATITLTGNALKLNKALQAMHK